MNGKFERKNRWWTCAEGSHIWQKISVRNKQNLKKEKKKLDCRDNVSSWISGWFLIIIRLKCCIFNNIGSYFWVLKVRQVAKSSGNVVYCSHRWMKSMEPPNKNIQKEVTIIRQWPFIDMLGYHCVTSFKFFLFILEGYTVIGLI